MSVFCFVLVFLTEVAVCDTGSLVEVYSCSCICCSESSCCCCCYFLLTAVVRSGAAAW